MYRKLYKKVRTAKKWHKKTTSEDVAKGVAMLVRLYYAFRVERLA